MRSGGMTEVLVGTIAEAVELRTMSQDGVR